MSTITAAAQFAARAHDGQIRKHGDPRLPEPYFMHLTRVAGIVAALPGSTDEMVAAAFLHDILEDTKYDYPEVEARFGRDIAKLVHGLTAASKRSGAYCQLKRAKRKSIDRADLKYASKEVKIIKLADRLDNITDFAKTDTAFKYKYAEETQDLLKVIGDAHEELTEKIEKVLDVILNQ